MFSRVYGFCPSLSFILFSSCRFVFWFVRLVFCFCVFVMFCVVFLGAGFITSTCAAQPARLYINTEPNFSWIITATTCVATSSSPYRCPEVPLILLRRSQHVFIFANLNLRSTEGNQRCYTPETDSDPQHWRSLYGWRCVASPLTEVLISL